MFLKNKAKKQKIKNRNKRNFNFLNQLEKKVLKKMKSVGS